MATNQDNRNLRDEKNQDYDAERANPETGNEKNSERDLKDLNSEEFSSKENSVPQGSQDDSDDEVPNYDKSTRLSRTSVRDRIPKTFTDNTPER